MENCENYHISKTVLTDIIRVFLLGLPWENTLDATGDMIIDPITNRAWCRWREVQALRPRIVNHLKGYKMTEKLATEMEKIFKEIGGGL